MSMPWWWTATNSQIDMMKRGVFEGLLKSKQYSDLTLICEGQEFPVHKAIVCMQSPVIAAACNGKFKEASENIIHVKGFDVGTVTRMIEWLYLGEYQDKTSNIDYDTAAAAVADYEYDANRYPEFVSSSSPSSLSSRSSSAAATSPPPSDSTHITLPDFSEWLPDPEEKAEQMLNMLQAHIGVSAIADYYCIERLRERANTIITYIMHSSWSAKGFLAAVEQIFEVIADKDLHSVMGRIAVDHLQELIQLEEFGKMNLPSALAVHVIRRAGAGLGENEEKIRHMEKENADLWDWMSERGYDYLTENWNLRRHLNDLNECADKLRDSKDCPGCGTAFNGYIHEVPREGGSSFVVTCRQCSGSSNK